VLPDNTCLDYACSGIREARRIADLEMVKLFTGAERDCTHVRDHVFYPAEVQHSSVPPVGYAVDMDTDDAVQTSPTSGRASADADSDDDLSSGLPDEVRKHQREPWFNNRAILELNALCQDVSDQDVQRELSLDQPLLQHLSEPWDANNRVDDTDDPSEQKQSGDRGRGSGRRRGRGVGKGRGQRAGRADDAAMAWDRGVKVTVRCLCPAR